MLALTKPSAWCALAVVMLTAPCQSFGDVELPNIFSDHMVLQQGQPNRIWGRAAPGECLCIILKAAKVQKQTVADEHGDWSIELDPLPAGGPHELVICGCNTIKIQDVLVGEVWICSGQSNMQWPVGKTYDADLVCALADYPQIRMINFPQVGSQEPIWTHKDSAWKVCSPQTVAGFSAVGYFFGLKVHQATDAPIGLINNAWGGSAADAWINRELLENNEDYLPTLEQWRDIEARYESLSVKDDLRDEEKKQLDELHEKYFGRHRPGNIYNGVLKSHLGYGLRGAIWYQGESNTGRAYQYRKLFPMMISNWRDEWGQGDFDLPPSTESTPGAIIRALGHNLKEGNYATRYEVFSGTDHREAT